MVGFSFPSESAHRVADVTRPIPAKPTAKDAPEGDERPGEAADEAGEENHGVAEVEEPVAVEEPSCLRGRATCRTRTVPMARPFPLGRASRREDAV